MASRRSFLKMQLGAATGLVAAPAFSFFGGGKKVKITPQQNVKSIVVGPSGFFPNNPKQALVIYQGAFAVTDFEGASQMEEVFKQNGWGNNWRNGIYSYHHYHSVAHEFIGVYGGNADLQFGGPDGPVVHVERGDALVIPAGVAHKKIKSSFGFSVVGAYPQGQGPDMKYGKAEEVEKAMLNIAKVGIPQQDPLFGESGPLIKIWAKERKGE